MAIVAVALFIAYNVQKGTKTLQEFKADYFNNEQVQEVADLAKELYNKDAQAKAVKKAPKKEKPVEDLEVITPEVVEKVVEFVQVTPEPTTVNVEVVLEQLKKEVSTTDIGTVKPKKKRKYYPKKK